MAVLNFDMENAKIIYRNFSGEATKFNPAGKRNFSLILDEESAEKLKADGWNVKCKEFEDGDKLFTLKVNVVFGKKPPIVYLITNNGTKKKKTPLTAETIGTLDYADIKEIDLSVRGWVYDEDTGAISAYLQVGYFTVATDKFSSKYDFDEIDETPFD